MSGRVYRIDVGGLAKKIDQAASAARMGQAFDLESAVTSVVQQAKMANPSDWQGEAQAVLGQVKRQLFAAQIPEEAFPNKLNDPTRPAMIACYEQAIAMLHTAITGEGGVA